MRPLPHLLLGLSLLASPAVAFAQDVDVEALHRRGLTLREQGRAADALELFRQAQALRPEPRTLARMGLAEAELARWPDAEQHLVEALAGGRDRWVRHNREDLEAELDSVRAHLGTLEVLSRAPGASLALNGGEARPLPLSAPLRVAEGTINLEVSAPGCESARRSVAVAARGTAHIDVDLSCRPPNIVEPAPPAAQPAVVLVAPRPAPPPVVTPPPPPRIMPPSHAPDRTTRVLAWSAWGGALVLAGVGVAGLVAGGAAADRWNDDAQCLGPGRSRESLCAGDRDAAETMGAVATAGFVGAGVLAATGTVLWILSGHGGERPAAAQALRCAPSLGSPSVHCAFVF